MYSYNFNCFKIYYKRPKLRLGPIPTISVTTEQNVLTDLSTSKMVLY
jgi:hypothetical protein